MTMKVTSNMTIYAHWESLAAESRFKKGKLWYKVVKPALSTSKEGTVSVVGPVNKNLRKATIPLTVKSGSFTYKVVSVAKFAFKNNKKLKNVKIGNNVQQISNGAFYGCTSLVKVTIGKNTEKIGSLSCLLYTSKLHRTIQTNKS